MLKTKGPFCSGCTCLWVWWEKYFIQLFFLQSDVIWRYSHKRNISFFPLRVLTHYLGVRRLKHLVNIFKLCSKWSATFFYCCFSQKTSFTSFCREATRFTERKRVQIMKRLEYVNFQELSKLRKGGIDSSAPPYHTAMPLPNSTVTQFTGWHAQFSTQSDSIINHHYHSFAIATFWWQDQFLRLIDPHCTALIITICQHLPPPCVS